MVYLWLMQVAKEKSVSPLWSMHVCTRKGQHKNKLYQYNSTLLCKHFYVRYQPGLSQWHGSSVVSSISWVQTSIFAEDFSHRQKTQDIPVKEKMSYFVWLLFSAIWKKLQPQLQGSMNILGYGWLCITLVQLIQDFCCFMLAYGCSNTSMSKASDIA